MISEVKPKAKAWRHFKVEASYSLITHACLMPMGTTLIYFNHMHSTRCSQHLKYQSLTPHKDSDIQTLHQFSIF